MTNRTYTAGGDESTLSSEVPSNLVHLNLLRLLHIILNKFFHIKIVFAEDSRLPLCSFTFLPRSAPCWLDIGLKACPHCSFDNCLISSMSLPLSYKKVSTIAPTDWRVQHHRNKSINTHLYCRRKRGDPLLAYSLPKSRDSRRHQGYFSF